MPHVALLKSQVHCTCMHGFKITICGNILMVSLDIRNVIVFVYHAILLANNNNSF